MAIIALIIAIPILVIAVTIGINGCISVFFGFCYRIAHVFLWMIDFAQSLMRRLCGLNDDGGNILMDFMKDPNIINAFWGIFVIALVLVVTFTIIQIARLQWTTEGSKNAVGPVVKTALKSFIMFLMIPTFSFIGIGVSNMFIEVVDEATSVTANEDETSRSIAGQIFVIACEDANPYRKSDKIDWVWSGWDDFGLILLNGVTFGVAGDYDSKTGIIDRVTGTSNRGEDKVYYEGNKIKGAENLGLSNNADEIDLKFSQLTEDAIKFESGFRLQSNHAKRLENDDPINYTNYDAVYYMYNLSRMNYAVLYIAGYFVLKALIDITFGLVMRIYKIIILFVVSPYPVAASVLDDGQALNKWKGKFIGELFSSYAVVAGLNLFMMLLPSIVGKNGIKVFTAAAMGSRVGFYNSIAQIIFLIVGCMMIKDIVGIISDLLGANNAMAEGEGMSKQVGDMAAKAGQVAIGGLTMAGSAAFAVGAGAMTVAKSSVNAFQNKQARKRSAQANKKSFDKDKDKPKDKDIDKKYGIDVMEESAKKDEAAADKLAMYEDRIANGQGLLNYEQKEYDELSNNGTKTSKDYADAAKKTRDKIDNERSTDAYKKDAYMAKSAKWSKHARNSANSMAKSMRNVYRGSAALKLGATSLIGNTTIGKMVDQGTFGLLHKENRDKLDESISKSGGAGRAVMDAAKIVDKERESQGGYWLNKLPEKIRDAVGVKDRADKTGVSVDNILNPFERLLGAVNNNLGETAVTTDFIANFDPSDINALADAIGGVIGALMNNPSGLDETTIRNFVADRATIESTVGSYSDKSMVDELKRLMDGLQEGLQYKEGSKERTAAFDKASISAAKIDKAGGFAKIDPAAVAEIKNALKTGTGSLKTVMDNKAYSQELRNIIAKGFSEAMTRVQKAKNDSKQDNLVAELLRQILEVTKNKK